MDRVSGTSRISWRRAGIRTRVHFVESSSRKSENEIPRQQKIISNWRNIDWGWQLGIKTSLILTNCFRAKREYIEKMSFIVLVFHDAWHHMSILCCRRAPNTCHVEPNQWQYVSQNIKCYPCQSVITFIEISMEKSVFFMLHIAWKWGEDT